MTDAFKVAHGWVSIFTLVVLGLVLSTLRAVAATIPVLIAYDAAVRPWTTTQVETGSSLRREHGGLPEYAYDGAHHGYDQGSNPLAVGGEGADHAYDRAVESLEWREVGGGVISTAVAGGPFLERCARERWREGSTRGLVLEQPHFDTSPANGGEVKPLHMAVVRIERQRSKALIWSKGSGGGWMSSCS